MVENWASGTKENLQAFKSYTEKIKEKEKEKKERQEKNKKGQEKTSRTR